MQNNTPLLLDIVEKDNGLYDVLGSIERRDLTADEVSALLKEYEQ